MRPMPSKGQVQADREADARRVAARARLAADVGDAIAAGVPAEEVAKIVARALREGGMLASADAVTMAARETRTKRR